MKSNEIVNNIMRVWDNMVKSPLKESYINVVVQLW